jgi:hypothetical protein
MQKKWFLALIVLTMLTSLALAVACGDDDDDDDDNDPCDGFEACLTGTLNYDGDLVTEAAQLLVAITDEWPMSQAPIWYEWTDLPEGGFPGEYRVGLNYTGEYYVLAAIDVDPNDIVGMNPDTDPLAVPEGLTDIQPGENTVNFAFLDPGEWTVDDDDDDDDDNDTTPPDDDDDTTPSGTGIYGTLTYTGTAEGAKVVFGFWDGLPMGPPDHSAETAVPQEGFPFDYEVDTTFTGDWRVVAFLDVNPNDGPSINFDLDPNNWSMSLPFTTINDGEMTLLDIALLDP